MIPGDKPPVAATPRRSQPTPLEHPRTKPRVGQRPQTDAPHLRNGSFVRTRSLLGKKWVLFALAALLIVIAVGIIFISRSSSTASSEAPEWHALLPSDKSITQLGGWQRVSPPKSSPVFAFTDTIDGVPISVSQQQLPNAFVEDIDGKVAELARSYNATDKLTAGSTTAYIGTSAKGPQSVIFAKNNLLVLIKSEKPIKDDSWISYIKNLTVDA